MKIINHEQRSSDWKIWRQKKIGSSDIAAIAGFNPYRKAQDVYDDWLCGNESVFVNEHMQRGIDNEPVALELANKEFECNLVPICIESEDNPRFIASLDGYDAELDIMGEMKCPTHKNFIAWKFEIPKMYVVQVQWQLAVSKKSVCHICVYDVETGDFYTRAIERDEALIKTLEDKANEFLAAFDNFEVLPPIYQAMPDSVHLQLEMIKEVRKKIKQQEDCLDALQASLYLDLGEGNFKGFGVTIGSKKGRETYDYKAMLSDGMEIEKYKKVGKPSRYLKVED